MSYNYNSRPMNYNQNQTRSFPNAPSAPHLQNNSRNYHQNYNNYYSNQYYQQQNQSQNQQADSKNQLWMGELDPTWDENTIKQIWLAFGSSPASIKLIREKSNPMLNAGYCFINFHNQQSANDALMKNGLQIPGTTKIFKLNWASGSIVIGNSQNNSMGQRQDFNSDFPIFVGDLTPDINDSKLFDFFLNKYPSTLSARIMIDPVTNSSRGYGFVKFSSKEEQFNALNEMNGAVLSGRPIRVSTAAQKSKTNQSSLNPALQSLQSNSSLYNSNLPIPNQTHPSLNQFTDPNNTTVFIGGLSTSVTEDELRSHFQPFGDIIYVKIPIGKGCGFVQFVLRSSAELAITNLQGFPIGNSRIRLSWGRSNFINNRHQPVLNNVNLPYTKQEQTPLIYGSIGDPSMSGFSIDRNDYETMQNLTYEPTDSDMNRFNELYLTARESRLDRLENNANGYALV